MERRARLGVQALALGVACALVGCAGGPVVQVAGGEYRPPAADWRIPLEGTGWEIAAADRSPDSAVVTYVPEGHDVETASELVVTQTYFLRASQARVADFASGLEASMEDCKDFEWHQHFDRGPEDVTLEWKHSGCEGGTPPLHQLIRYKRLRGRIHAVSYARRHRPIDDETRERWLVALRTARLIEPAPIPAFAR